MLNQHLPTPKPKIIVLAGRSAPVPVTISPSTVPGRDCRQSLCFLALAAEINSTSQGSGFKSTASAWHVQGVCVMTSLSPCLPCRVMPLHFHDSLKFTSSFCTCHFAINIQAQRLSFSRCGCRRCSCPESNMAAQQQGQRVRIIIIIIMSHH